MNPTDSKPAAPSGGPHSLPGSHRLLGLAALVVGLSCAGTVRSDDGEDLASAEQALDDVCTPDPVVVDSQWGTRWMGQAAGAGFDLYHLNVLGPHCESAPGTPGYDSRCCAMNGGSTSYAACKAEQAVAVESFLSTFTPKIALLRPWRRSDVAVIQGYHYNWGATHTGALDIARQSVASGADPSFDVYAVAPGTVLWAGWGSATAGNSVLIRHEIPGGGWYLSEYRHVRGGADTDKVAACPCIDVAASTANGRLANCSPQQWSSAICQYAANPSYDYLWGSVKDTLPVAGTVVSRGQRILAAGNTGTVTLNDDGTTQSSTGNTHLHLSFWVPRPGGVDDGQPGTDIIAVDPLSVYSKTDGGVGGVACYDVAAPTAYTPALAPHLPDFTSAPSAAVQQHALLYPNAGWGPQSLSFYTSPSGVRAAGSFHPAAQPTDWKLWLELDQATMEQKLAGYPTRRLRQLSVRLDGATPRFTGIWEGRPAGTQAKTLLGLSTAALDVQLDIDVTNGAYEVTDLIGYVANGVLRHGVTLATGAETKFVRAQTQSQLEAVDAVLQSAGWRPVAASATVGATGANVRYAAVWSKAPGNWSLEPSVPIGQFTILNDQKKVLGYRLHRVQAYDDGSRVLAIWSKPTAPTCGLPSCARVGVCAPGLFKSVPVCPGASRCPNGLLPARGQCAVPVDAAGKANCINTDPLNCPPGTPVGFDCRTYNWEARTATGALCSDAGGDPVCGAHATNLCEAY